MNANSVVAILGAGCCGGTAFAVILKKSKNLSVWSFAAGMFLLGIKTAFSAAALSADSVEQIIYWEELGFAAASLMPVTWLLFSLTYARGNYREFLMRWRFVLLVSFLPVILYGVGFRDDLIVFGQRVISNGHWMLRLGVTGFALNLFLLGGAVLVLMNLERTYRAAVGTMRWRLKFMILGIGLIFSVQAYIASQVLLYHAIDITLRQAESLSLILGCFLMLRSLLRAGHFDMDIYPPRAALRDSFTIVIAGIYLFIVGVLAKIVAFLGEDASFALKSFVVLIGLVVITLLLLSDRVRLHVRRFLSRHFQRPFYDYRALWRKFTEATTRCVEKTSFCLEIVKLVSEIFQALSVSVWITNEEQDGFNLAASTSAAGGKVRELELELDGEEAARVIAGLISHANPLDLDSSSENWAVAIRRLQPAEFHRGGNRIAVPLIAGGDLIGMMLLGDRVSGLPFSVQDFDLLKSIADQIAANLLNLKLSQRLSQAKQLEAFQAMSTFFVHDLKNTASTLSLMLHNLPTHFNDPRFREDALRGVSKTVTHINDLIRRLSLLRQEMAIQLVEADLNGAVVEALKWVEPMQPVDLIKNLHPLPKVRIDLAQIQNVITNLVLNARDALGAGGQIRVETATQNGWVVLTVSDNGCGMSREFIRNSLFRPFQTTKKRGLGIGMFQCKIIVEAHHGKIEVQSDLAKGTTFRVLLPLPEK